MSFDRVGPNETQPLCEFEQLGKNETFLLFEPVRPNGPNDTVA